MPEITPQHSDEIARLEERASKLAQDKSYLRQVMDLMNKVSSAQGLDNMTEILLSNILNVIGGANIILYYLIDDDIYYADLMGAKQRIDRIDDELVKRVFESREAMEFEQDFGDTQIMAQEFTKAYTGVYPLMAGTELVGIIKLENLHIAMREELPTLFTYVATVIKNEIFSHTQLKVAYDQMALMNEDLEIEIEERIKTEEKLRAARDELEMRVEDRTAALQALNEQLQLELGERIRVEEEIRKVYTELEKRVEARTNDLKAKRLELEESQRALMNIVEDLNEKTTELEDANTRLQELERLKSMFIASMSHELRTPLNSIIGFSSILYDEWLGPVNVEQKENLAIILRSGKHLLSLINDVIDVSKIEAGKIESAAEEFDLYELIMEGIAYVAKDIRDKGLGLKIEVAHLTMTTDRQRLLQCLLNLLSNAMKFTEKGEVSITAQAVSAPGGGNETSCVEISVTDSGIGIREEDLPKMFSPFVRLVPPGQATIPGTGLGLYLTRKLAVEILRGDILLMSEYGKGSCFTIKIPARTP